MQLVKTLKMVRYGGKGDICEEIHKEYTEQINIHRRGPVKYLKECISERSNKAT